VRHGLRRAPGAIALALGIFVVYLVGWTIVDSVCLDPWCKEFPNAASIPGLPFAKMLPFQGSVLCVSERNPSRGERSRLYLIFGKIELPVTIPNCREVNEGWELVKENESHDFRRGVLDMLGKMDPRIPSISYGQKYMIRSFIGPKPFTDWLIYVTEMEGSTNVCMEVCHLGSNR
jgi:hypothetical protein